MKKGVASPDKNRGERLVMVAQTRTPLEAFKMLKMGHPIDQAAGYYDRQGVLDDDFYMLDRIGKLKALAGYRERVAAGEKELYEFKKASEKAKADQEFQRKLNEEVTKKMSNNERQQKAESPGTQGQVS